MGGGSSQPVEPQCNAIDQQLIDQQLEDLFKFKILLLGAGESGKSTIVKQLKVIHQKVATPKELRVVGTSLHQNVVDCMLSLLTAARSFGYADFSFDQLRTEGMLQAHEETDRITPELAERIVNLFHSEMIQKTFDRRAEFWLLDSLPYYIKHLARFCEPDFVPTEEDSVMARIRTTGIVNSELEQSVEKSDPLEPDTLKFQVVDVGGQRNERKKWMHCFDDVRAILFIVNLAGYDQVLFEDTAKNRMLEELELFEQITHNVMFDSVPIFLFLNKKDLFSQMVASGAHPLSRTFREYQGCPGVGVDAAAAGAGAGAGAGAVQPALEFVMELFRRKLPAGKTVSIHPVSARWKKDVRAAFDDVKKTLYDCNRDELLRQAAEIRQAQMRRSAAERERERGGVRCGCI